MRINGEISAPEVRLVGLEGEQLGIVSLAQATSLAEEKDPESGEQREGYCVARVDLDEVRKCREEFQTLQTRQPTVYRSLVKRY